MIPFHSPFSFFFPNVLSLTISISNEKLSLSDKSSKISIQKPTSLSVLLLPFGAKMIQNRIKNFNFYFYSYAT